MAVGNKVALSDRTPFEHIHNFTPDISDLLEFSWYQWDWYYDALEKNSNIGRWLGPAHNVGQGLAYYILTESGEVIVRSTVSVIFDDEKREQMVELFDRKQKFTRNITE